MNAKVLGIDLGTTNSVVALANGVEARALADAEGRRLIPSVVSFHPDGSILVGHEARERRLVDARNTVYSTKRLIGRPYTSIEVQKAKERFAFELEATRAGGVQVRARKGAFALPEISAMVLRHLRRVAEDSLGEPCSRAVVTVPANFNELQRSATQAAGKVAGLDVLRILNEPTAATLAYGLSRETAEKVAVYDLGGGTFDLTILDLDKDVFEVVSTAGDTFLGGDDIDLMIAEKMREACLREHRYDALTDPQCFERMRAAAEWAKCQLSLVSVVDVTLEELFQGVGGRAVDFTFHMTRVELEALIQPIIARTFDIVNDALRAAGRRPKEVDSVVLVGGSTRIPLVRSMVEEFFARGARIEIDPDLVVAQGAAIHGFTIGGDKPAIPEKKQLGRIALRKSPVRPPEKMPRQPAFAPDEVRDDKPARIVDTALTTPISSIPVADAPRARTATSPGLRPGTPIAGQTRPADARGGSPPLKRITAQGLTAPQNTFSDGIVPEETTSQSHLRGIPKEPVYAEETTSQASVAKGNAVRTAPPIPVGAPIDTARPPMTAQSPAYSNYIDTSPPPDRLAPEPEQAPLLRKKHTMVGVLGTPGGDIDLPFATRPAPPVQLPPAPPARPAPPPPRAPLEDFADVPTVVVSRSAIVSSPAPVPAAAPAPTPAAPPAASTLDRPLDLSVSAFDVSQLDFDASRALDNDFAAPPARDIQPREPTAKFQSSGPAKVKTLPDITLPDSPAVPPQQAVAKPHPVPAPAPQQAFVAPQASLPQPPARPAPSLPVPEAAPAFPAMPMGAPLAHAKAPVALVNAPAPRQAAVPMSGRAAPLLMDVTPLSLGIETVGGFCQAIVQRNAPIPTEKTRVYATARDGQTEVELRVCQGESNRFDENQALGVLMIGPLRQAKRGDVRIEITFMIDQNGILDVKAIDLDARREQAIRISLKGGVDMAEVNAMRARQEGLFGN